MDEPLKCPHGLEVCVLPDGEPYFPTPCRACEDTVAEPSIPAPRPAVNGLVRA